MLVDCADNLIQSVSGKRRSASSEIKACYLLFTDMLTDEYMQMLKDFGWEYFAQCFGWLYFRKPADTVESEQDGELFSDNASRAEMVNHVVKTRLIPLAIIFLCCVLPNFIRYASGEFIGGFRSFFGIFFGVMFVVYVFLIVYCGNKLRKIKGRYEN